MNNSIISQENIIDRDELQKNYVQNIIDGCDMEMLYKFAEDYLNDSLDKYTVNELIEEVEEYYPELLE